MNALRLVAWPILAAVLAAAFAMPGTASACPSAAEVDRLVTAAMKDGNVPGVSVAVVCNGAVAYERGYGVRDVATSAPVDANTIFRFGSVTKQFVAAAVLQLASEGKLALSDPIAKWYPQATSASAVTVADLLGLVAGYRDYYPLDYVDLEMSRPIAVDDIIGRYGSYPLTAPPRTRLEYSNTNYTIAGRIVERVSGEPLQAYLRRKVFTPLRMLRTDWDEPPRADNDRATGYNSFFGEVPHDDAFEAPMWLNFAAALAGTAGDLARWDIGLTNRTVLDNDSFRAMGTPGVLANGARTGYGLGVSVQSVDGHRVLAHGGNVIGFASANFIAPDDGAAVAVLTNSYEAPAETIAARLLRAVLSGGPAPRPPVPPAVSAPMPLAPAGSEEARFQSWIAHLQAGDPDRSQMTADFQALMDATNVARARDALAPLGPLRSLVITSRYARGGLFVTEADAGFASRSYAVTMFAAPDGKVAEFFLVPKLP